MFKSLSTATIHRQYHLCSQQGAWAVLGVSHEYHQQHMDMKRKSQSLLGRVTQELPLSAA